MLTEQKKRKTYPHITFPLNMEPFIKSTKEKTFSCLI